MTRELPQDLLSEASLIATCAAPGGFQEPGVSAALVRLEPKHFMHPAHAYTWRAIKAVWERGEEANSLVLRDQLEVAGDLARVGDFTGLLQLLGAEEVGRPQVLAEIVLDRWRRRRWIQLASKLARHAEDPTFPEPLIAQEFSEGVRLIQSGQSVLRKSGNTILEKLESLTPFCENPDGGILPRMRWNLDPFDDVLERAPGQLLLVAARPGVGKTALMVQGFGATLRTGERALFISLELSEAELEARLAAWFTGTHARRLRDGRYEATTVFKAREDQAAFERASYLCMPSNTPWNVLEAEIRCAVHQDNVSSVWLDYFTLIQRPVGQKGQTDAALWGQLSTQIRALAQSLGLVFVLASQLNRGSTEYEEPGLSDLRETGQLEQDAHAVLMLWKGKEGAGEFPMGKLAKNRGGEKTMRTRLWCEYATNRWNVETRETTPSAPAGRGRL